MHRLLGSTSLRIALAYAGIFVLSSLILGAVLWWGTVRYLDSEIDAVILADTQAIGDQLRFLGLPGAARTISDRVEDTADEHAIYLLADPLLHPLAGNMAAWPIEVDRRPGWYQAELVRQGKRYATRLLNVALPGEFHLLVGRDVQNRVELRALILEGLGWAALAAAALAVAGGLLVRRAVLARVAQLNTTTTAIVQGQLSRRLPTRASADEFDQLARTINEMLAQIELLVDGVRNASNAIAHDLRTPLGELRARLESLARGRPNSDSTGAEIEGAIADVDRLIGIFNALLRLAAIDSGARRAGFREVDLAALVREVAEVYGPLAEERGVVLAAEPGEGLVVTGDPSMLAQAIGNLVDNAVKYAPARGRVELAARKLADGRLAVSVADNGPGIAEAERAKVVERFYRGDASRGTPGVGLGLAEVAAVARLHGGALELADNGPGLAASLILPAKD